MPIASGKVEQRILPYVLAFPWPRRRTDLGRTEAEQVGRSQDVDQRHLTCASRHELSTRRTRLGLSSATRSPGRSAEMRRGSSNLVGRLLCRREKANPTERPNHLPRQRPLVPSRILNRCSSAGDRPKFSLTPPPDHRQGAAALRSDAPGARVRCPRLSAARPSRVLRRGS